MANVPLKSVKFPGLDDTYTVPQIDANLTASGKAADAKVTGDSFNEFVEVAATPSSNKVHILVSPDSSTIDLATQDEVDELKNDKADSIIGTATGEVANFIDAEGGTPIQSVISTVEPTQEFNGYDKPWIGGCNVNILPYPYFDSSGAVSNGITFTVNDKGVIHAKGTATGNAVFWCHKALNTTIPQWIKASTDYRVEAISNGSARLQFTLYGNSTFAKADVGFTMPADLSIYTGSAIAVLILTGTTIDDDIFPMFKLGTASATWLPFENECVITGKTYLTLSHSDDDTTSPDTTTVSWTNPVYGADASLIDGKLTVKTALLVDDGSSGWNVDTLRNGFYKLLSGIGMKTSNFYKGYCNFFPVAYVGADMNKTSFTLGVNNKALFISHVTDTNPHIQTLSDWTTYLSAHPLKVVYPLATETETDLTPVPLIAKPNVNNIWTDVGKTTVTYFANTTLHLETLNGWYGKKYASIGDSITWGFTPKNTEGYRSQLKSYAQLTADRLGMTLDNQAIPGCTFSVVEGYESVYPIVNRYTDLPDDADIITVTGGTNDVRLGGVLGTMSDRGTDTYYGALHTVLGGLYKKYFIDQGTAEGTKKKVVVITPIKLLNTPASTSGGNGELYSWDSWIEAVKEVAAYYSFPVLDFYNISNINPHLNCTVYDSDEDGYYNPYITDGVHPTQEGQKIMADALTSFLKNLK